MKVFLYAFNALAPILILCFAGYYLKVKQIFNDDFFKKINRFAFRYCFPPLMFVNLYSLEGVRKINVRLGGFLLVSLMVITAVAFVLGSLLTDQPGRKAVLVQAGFRSNFALIGMALVEGLVGTEGLGVTASMQAPVVLYFNFCSVFVLTLYAENARFSFKRVGKSIAVNPLIQGLTAGLIALIVRELIPLNGDGSLAFSLSRDIPWLYTSITYFSRVATPLALISLGGQFEFSKVSGLRKELIGGVLMRLILAPILGFSMTYLAVRAGFITMTPAVAALLIAGYGSPLAVSAAPMAAEMHADATLAGQLVIWTSTLSMFTIFILVVVFRAIGLL